MEKKHRNIINDNISDLINVTTNIEAIVNNLLEKHIINNWMKEYILGYREDALKNKNLYLVIQGRGPKAFSEFCRTLEDTSNIRARNILLSSKSRIGNTGIPDDLLNNGLSTNDLNHVKPYVKIHPQRLRMDLNDENLPISAYPMGSNPKGHVLILNMTNIEIKDEGIILKREGSNVDVACLKQLFEGLGYDIELKVDSTLKELKEVIKQFVENCDNAKIDSVVVFVMSHGNAAKDSPRSSDILTADGIRFNSDWLVEQFEPYNFKKNIPKLFFIQACRGTNIDNGWIPSDSGDTRLQNDSTHDSSIGNIVNRRYENVFIANATVPGYYAKRDPIDGSWFVQKLCEVIRENAWRLDLNSMMKMVDLEVRNLNSIVHGFQTTEWTYRGFNKKFYFNPGLYDDDNQQTSDI